MPHEALLLAQEDFENALIIKRVLFEVRFACLICWIHSILS